MGLITSAGVGSGIDVEAIIGAILNAERSPKESSLSRNEDRVDSTLSALGQLSSALSKLNDTVDNLNNISDFRVRSATSSDDSFLTATTTSEASSGSFSIIVDTLAQGSRLESIAGDFSAVTDTVGSGTLTFTAGSDTFDIVVGASDTLEDIRDAINAGSDNFGVNVNIINGGSGPVLSITSSISGTNKTLSITNNNSSLDKISTNLNSAQTANGATAHVDGILVSSDTNVFKDAIQDISFTAVKVTEAGSPITLDIAIDEQAVKDAIKSFVDAFNEFQTLSLKLGQTSEASSGALSGDSTLRILNSSIVSSVQDSISGITSNFNSLNSIGVTFDRNRKLQIDDDALDAVVKSNFDDIANVFASTNGVSVRLQNVLDSYIGSGSLIDLREDSLNEQKRKLEGDRLNLNYRMTQLETQLRKKFGAMDGLVAQLNNTGSFLTQQLANLPGFDSQ